MRLGSTLVLAAFLFTALALPALALDPAAADASHSAKTGKTPVAIRAQALSTVKALNTISRSPWQVRWDASTGLPARLSLSATDPMGQSPEEAARGFLKTNAGMFTMQEGSNLDLKTVEVQESAAGQHVRFIQQAEGLPVWQGNVSVHMDKALRVQAVNSHYVPIPKVASGKTAIPQAKAVEMARLAARVEGSLRGEPSVRQVVYAEEGTPVKAWEVVLPSSEPLGDFEVVIDAASGRLLSLVNLIKQAEAKAKVFNPNPVVTLKNNTLRDNNDADSAAFAGGYVDVTLLGLDNPKKLKGQFVEITGNSLTDEEVDAAAGFNFKRNQKGFEGAMVYFHIDRIQRYFQSIGFKNANNRVQKANPHGTTDDNSWYSPMNKELTFGDGGVDDAEDSDIIAHEYGHSTQDNQCPGFGRTNEGGSMGEGFGDYLASSVRADLTFQRDVVGSWDATAYSNAPEPALRRMDSPKHYPEDMQGEVHADGEIWAATLWQLWNKLGKDVCDKIVMESHFSLSPQSQFADGANAIIQADQNLFGGAHVDAIKGVFVDRGILKQ